MRCTQLAKLVADAAPWMVQLERTRSSAGGASEIDDLEVDVRLARWRQLIARGDAERFARRLSWDGFDDAIVRSALRPTSLPDDAAKPRIPSWAHFLVEVIAVAGRLSASASHASPPRWTRDRALNTEAPTPFDQVMLPFVVVARRRLRARAAAVRRLLSARAQASLERALLRRLVSAAAPTLLAEQTAFVRASEHCTDSDAMLAGITAELLRSRLVPLLLEHPVLARLSAAAAERWVCTTAEVLERLAKDRGVIGAAFFGDAPIGRVEAVDAELSDSHDGQRTVCILHFHGGGRLVYKPRSLAPEAAYFGFLGWLSARGLKPTLSPLGVLDRGRYGWMQHGAVRSCVDDAAVRRYYERAGMLIGLMHALGGSDLHSGNVLACGEHPMLVDLEVLMQPPLQHEGVGDTSALGVWQQLRGSVVATGLLPMQYLDPDGSGYSEGGLTARIGARSQIRTNTPALGGEAVTEHVAEILAGFRRLYRLLVTHRTELLAPDGPLVSFRDVPVRVLLRTTALYSAVLARSLAPAYLRSGAARAIELDVLKRPFLAFERRHRLWPALSAEMRSLEEQDVPMFHMAALGTALTANTGELVREYSVKSGYDSMIDRIQAMDNADMESQAHCIRIAFASYQFKREGAVAGLSAALRPRPSVSSRPAYAPDLADARAIADLLRRVAVYSPDGAASWFALTDAPGRGGPREVGLTLCTGRIGIAVFLAALEHLSGDGSHVDLALAALNPVTRLLSSADSEVARLGIGGADGLGGIVYGLTRVAHFLSDPEVAAAAQQAAALITPDRIEADVALDVFAGSAGALLGLLALFRMTGDPAQLEKARACARHILRRRAIDPVSGRRAWPTLGGHFTTGFAHGAGGIAHALVTLYRATGDSELLYAASEAHEFESSLFVPERNNWLSQPGMLPRARTVPLMCGWCHGAAGIGLARAACVDVLDSASLRRDVAAAVAAVVEARLPRPDHLCCGNLGRAEFLFTAAHRLGHKELATMALGLAAEATARARLRGAYSGGTLDDAFSPSLFYGIAGIGYQLLRFSQAGRLPSLLLWE